MALGVDVEGEARVLRERAGYDEDDVPGGMALAAALGVRVRKVDGGLLRGGDGCTIRVHGRPEVCIRRGLTRERTHWVIAHELFETRLGELDYRGEDIEQCAEAGAAALLMPRRSFRLAAREHGDDYAALAADYLCGQTAAVLRLAEVGAVEMAAVVAPARVHVRAPDDWVLPDLRKAAREGHPMLRRTALTDSRKRVALVA